MASDVTVNDAILQPFLLAQDSEESQRQLMILLSEYVEARIRGIITAHLRSYLTSQEHSADFEDLYSETKTRLVSYLYDLKAGATSSTCKDFRSYVAAIAHNVCHDYFRQMYPARARLRKKLRDLLDAHPDFALWQTKDQNKAEWVCGFDYWQGGRLSSGSNAWLQRFYENPEIATERLASGGDIQCMDSDELLASLFEEVGEGNDRPTFSWTALDGATSYTVSVFDADLHLIKTSEQLNETHWLMPDRVERGIVYTWTVTALKDGQETIAPAPPARAEFKVLGKAELRKLNHSLGRTTSHATRGVLYAEAGLLDDAANEFRTHLKLQPADRRAKRLLRFVKSWRVAK